MTSMHIEDPQSAEWAPHHGNTSESMVPCTLTVGNPSQLSQHCQLQNLSSPQLGALVSCSELATHSTYGMMEISHKLVHLLCNNFVASC